MAICRIQLRPFVVLCCCRGTSPSAHGKSPDLLKFRVRSDHTLLQLPNGLVTGKTAFNNKTCCGLDVSMALPLRSMVELKPGTELPSSRFADSSAQTPTASKHDALCLATRNTSSQQAEGHHRHFATHSAVDQRTLESQHRSK